MKEIELLIDESDEAGVHAVSLVMFPAIQEGFVYFNEAGGTAAQYTLAAVDEEQRILVGPAMIPEKRILRRDDTTGEEYEVFFSAATIAALVERYMEQARTTEHTYEHAVDVEGVVVVESWLVADPAADKSSLYGFSLPVGTWMLSVKVNNEAVWEKVKSKQVRGFSIEGYFADRLVAAKAIDPTAIDPSCLPKDEATLATLRELVLGELQPQLTVDGEPVFTTPDAAALWSQLHRGSGEIRAMDVCGVQLFRRAVS